MRDILDKDIYSIWNGTNKTDENTRGGIAIWTLPSSDIHNAFDPIQFVRRTFLHEVGETYKSPHRCKPNYISIDSYKVALVFQRQTTSRLFVEVSTPQGKILGNVPPFTKTFYMSDQCSEITSVDNIGLDAKRIFPYPVTDADNIYLRPGQRYQGDLYICKDAYNIVFRNDITDTSELTFRFMDGDSKTLTAESFKGKTVFDASLLVSSRFSNDLKSFYVDDIIEDRTLYTPYTVSGVGNTSLECLALNAVSQIGQYTDRSQDVGKVLSMFDKVKYYQQYPLDYSFLTGHVAIKTSLGEFTIPMTVSRLRVKDKANRPAKMEIEVVDECTPLQPFYVRWINELGGVDYWMFSKQQKKTISLDSVSTYSPYIESKSKSTSNIKPYAATTSERITVGAAGLDKQQHYALSKIPFSPLIEYYNEKSGKWMRLIPDKGNNTINSKKETNDIELSFTLPSVYIQY